MKTLTPLTYYHITKPSPIRWEEVTEKQYSNAVFIASKKIRKYSSCTIVSCVNPTRYKRRFYINFQGKFFTAMVPLTMNFINIVEQLDTESKF